MQLLVHSFAYTLLKKFRSRNQLECEISDVRFEMCVGHGIFTFELRTLNFSSVI